MTVEDVILSLSSLILVVVVYLAIAVSYLRERVARLEGRLNGRTPTREEH
jgi:hypothetical protein